MAYNYHIFQCNILSDIAISFLKTSKKIHSHTDIEITEDKSLLNDLIKFKKGKINYYETNLKNTQIYIKNIALFNINKNGVSIKYILQDKADMSSFYSKLLNHVVPYALYMQKKCVLHASGVAFDKNGFIFIGESGAGKSSLAASLKEMSFACEDSAYIEVKKDTNDLFLIPSFNIVKLDSRIHEILKLESNKITDIKIDKLNRSLYQVENFLKHKVKLKRCYILSWGE